VSIAMDEVLSHQNRHENPQALAEIARILAKPVGALRQAFQRGLGDAATCVLARLAFDNAQGAPVLVVYIRLPGESTTLAFADELISSDQKNIQDQAAEEGGAALRTAIECGLVKTGRASRSS
jgi:hypothetical protein